VSKNFNKNIVDEFANEGLRTLCMSYKVISNEEYNDYYNQITDANLIIDNRDLILKNVFSKIENNFEYLGSSAIQDELQGKILFF
jgi:phospholipid-translocating ATPase